MSCPNATISPLQDRINAAISDGDNKLAIRLLEADRSLIHACDHEGATPLHIAAQEANEEMVAWLLNGRAKVDKRDIYDRTLSTGRRWPPITETTAPSCSRR
jgi:ankyrin repeat protein